MSLRTEIQLWELISGSTACRDWSWGIVGYWEGTQRMHLIELRSGDQRFVILSDNLLVGILESLVAVTEHRP